MSPAVRKQVWESRSRVNGPDAPTTRAAFGRYVAAKGGWLTPVSSGPEAWVANRRAPRPTGTPRPGFLNRRHRKHLAGRNVILGPRGEVTAL